MQVDKTTLTDLSIFHADEDQSVFSHLNFTHTNGGREYLKGLLHTPLTSISKIQTTQQTIQILQKLQKEWPVTLINNGALLVIEKFYETAIDKYPQYPAPINSWLYSILHAPDYSITKYTVTHAVSFVKGMQQIVDLFEQAPMSTQITIWTNDIENLLKNPIIQEMLAVENNRPLSPQQALTIGGFLRTHFKRAAAALSDIFCKMDAYMSMAIAGDKYALVFPELQQREQPFVQANGLFHLLLPTPVAYDTKLDIDQNFIFLTGANMAGKSTYIKAIGLSVYLAHLGMGVPAKSMQLSFFDGLLSNIQVEDNIFKGESYFFNEVQRIKKTLEKISDGKKWLILIDELFKGTNIQDAMKCSTAVIEGLRKMNQSLFILSTHLYEIGENLKQYPNIQFRYFETKMENEQLSFSYHLKDGISNDRIGYLILQREGVTKILDSL